MRIRVRAAPANPDEMRIPRGRYGLAPALPAVLGQDSVGVIDALGDGVNGAAVDQHVLAVPRRDERVARRRCC